MIMIIDVCIYVSMSISDNVNGDHSCEGMIAYTGEWHEEVHSHEESSGRVSLIDI